MGKKNLLFACLALSFVFVGCAPSVKKQAINPDVEADPGCVALVIEAKVLPVLPDNSTIVGTIEIGDAGMSTDCQRDDVFQILKKEACKSDAQLVYIKESKNPDSWSTCYRAKADLVRVSDEDRESFAKAASEQQNAMAGTPKKEKSSFVWQVVGYTVGFAAGFLLVTLLLN